VEGMRIGAIGGLALVALCVTAIGVAAQSDGEEVAAPVEITGESTGGLCPDGGTSTQVGDVTQSRGFSCNPVYSWSDPRLEGTVTWTKNEDQHLDGSGLTMATVARRIENADGAWQQRPELGVTFPWSIEVAEQTWLHVFDGEGAYEGLIAVTELTCGASGECTQRGFIVDGEFPPPPEAASTD
jgi:hypothetical protein